MSNMYLYHGHKYTRVRGLLGLRARVHISGKPKVHMIQLIRAHWQVLSSSSLKLVMDNILILRSYIARYWGLLLISIFWYNTYSCIYTCVHTRSLLHFLKTIHECIYIVIYKLINNRFYVSTFKFSSYLIGS